MVSDYIKGDTKLSIYKVVIEYDENEGTAISYFLKLRYCVDLSRDTGYDELLEATNRNQGKRWKVLYILHI